MDSLVEESHPFSYVREFFENNDFTGLGSLEFDPYLQPADHQMVSHSSTNHLGFNDFEQMYSDFSIWDYEIDRDLAIPSFDATPHGKGFSGMHSSEQEVVGVDQFSSSVVHGGHEMMSEKGGCRRPKSCMLELEDVQKLFDVPITRAAKELNIGLTLLKKRCRELGIMRWPHRKIKSLKTLIHNVKEMGMSSEIGMLEEHRRMVEKVPEMELTERTKKLRQACFKANYKKRRTSSSSLRNPLLP